MESSVLSSTTQQQHHETGSCSFFRTRNTATRQQQQQDGAFGGGDAHLEAELAREMNELSVDERERVLDDIHGVAETPEETPEFIAKCLNELDMQLSKTPKARRRGYDKALFFRPTIQQDQKFKLMFLRADLYDGAKAAQRMVKYFEDKMELFGETKVAKDLTLSDLTEEDLTVWSSGCFLTLPHKDQVGRPIWFFDSTRYDWNRPDSTIRCCWYMIMVSIQSDEVAQKKGACNVAYNPGDLLALRAPMSKVSHLLSKGGPPLINLPMRITSYHFCYNDQRMKLFLSMARKFFGKPTRMRMRTHFGSDLEMQYALSTFGIQCKTLLDSESPGSVPGENDSKKQLHNEFIDRRRKIEYEENKARLEQEAKSGIILYPQLDDVLVGRGKPYQSFPGNVRFGGLIGDQNDEYHTMSDKFAKTCISIDIVKRVQEYGGRFIERTKTGDAWQVIDDSAAREKTAIGFRSRVSKVGMNGGSGMKLSRTLSPDMSMSSAKRLRYDPDVAISS